MNFIKNIVKGFGLPFQFEQIIDNTLKEERRFRRVRSDGLLITPSQDGAVQIDGIDIQLTRTQDAQVGPLPPVGQKVLQFDNLFFAKRVCQALRYDVEQRSGLEFGNSVNFQCAVVGSFQQIEVVQMPWSSAVQQNYIITSILFDRSQKIHGQHRLLVVRMIP